MEAATLPTKKAVNKRKIKKTLKNVLCRPDPIFWPTVSENQKKLLEAALWKYKVDIPEFNKPQWKDLKLIPKEKRPKAPKVKRIKGLFFGISECCHAIKNNSCAAVVVESTVTPRAIVQPVMDACINSRVPVICLSGLRSLSSSNFGIPTSSLGINHDGVDDLRTQILDIAKNFKLPPIAAVETECIEIKDICNYEDAKMETEPDNTVCPYLYRSSKKVRIFNPSEESVNEKSNTKFSGQDFIGLPEKKDSNVKHMDRKSYMKMVLKKISNNPKRAKVT